MYKYFFILFLLPFILFFGCESCNKEKLPNVDVNDIAEYEIIEPARQFPLELCVQDFDKTQQDAIKKALSDWNKFSNSIVTYNVQFDCDLQVPFTSLYYCDYDKITVWRKDWNDPSIFDLQMKYSLVADGFSIDNFIVIVDVGNLDYNYTYTIFAHEFGHTLGMEHIKIKYPALMNVTGNNGSFTGYDKVMFCYIYDCD
jgi:predicted Zn-dependent protease